jgi:hypothetical protein
MRYRVDTFEFGTGERVHLSRRVSLSKARKVATHQARRGFRLYGGSIANDNWGAHGGDFPRQYRTTIIRPE